MPTNSGKPVDSAGNLQVDFAWGNFPPQPNDVRTTATDTTATNRLTPGADNHDSILGSWGGYPAFSNGTKDTNNLYQGDLGKFGQSFSGTTYSTTATQASVGSYTIVVASNANLVVGQGVAAAGFLPAGTKVTAINSTTISISEPTLAAMSGTTVVFGEASKATYTPYINVPSVIGQTSVNAGDALRDNGTLNASIQSNTVVTGGRYKLTGWTTSGNTVTFAGATNHSFSVGDIVTIWGLGATLNGTYVAAAGTATTNIVVTIPGTPAATSTGTGYAVVTGQSLTTTATGSLGASTITVASATNITVGMTATATGIPTGTLVQSINGTSVQLSGLLTAALSTTSITFTTNALRAAGISTLKTDGTTATVNTTGAHGLVAGDTVTILNSAVKAAVTGTGAASQTSLVVSTAAGANSDQVFGPGIPAGATISSGGGTTTLVLSANITTTLVASSVSTTGTGTSGSTALTVASGTGTVNGHFVTGYGIPAGTIVSSGGGTTSIVLSNPLNVAISASAVTFSIGASTTGTNAAGQNIVNVAATTNLVVGQTVSGTGIPAGTVLVAINTLALTLSNNLTSPLVAGTVLTFSNLITVGLQSNGILNSGVTSNLPTTVTVASVPSTTSFTFTSAAAATVLSSDTYWTTSAGASNTSGATTLNVASGAGAFINAQIGSVVTGTGIAPGTVVLTRSTDAIGLSVALTATIPAGTLIGFSNGQVVPGVRTNTVSAQSVAAGAASTLGSTAITLSVYN